MFDRYKAIATLIGDDIDTIVDGGYTGYLHDLLRYGMKGYDNFTDEELMEELDERDIPYKEASIDD